MLMKTNTHIKENFVWRSTLRLIAVTDDDRYMNSSAKEAPLRRGSDVKQVSLPAARIKEHKRENIGREL